MTRSIVWVMIWEFLYQRRLFAVAYLLGASLLPWLVFVVLRANGLDVADASLHRVMFLFMSLNAFYSVALVIPPEGFRTRFYVFPCSTAMLVACQLIPAMIFAAVATVLLTMFQNALLSLNYPLWGPIFFALAGVGCFWATYWSTKGSNLQTVAFIAVMGSLCGWYALRYLAPIEPISDGAHAITAIEILVLALIVIASYFVSVIGVARNRCGEPLRSVSCLTAVRRFMDGEIRGALIDAPSFRSPMDAMAWYEWTKKGWTIPLVASFCLVFATSLWWVQSHQLDELVKGFFLGGFLLSFVLVIGGLLAFGNCEFGEIHQSKSTDPETRFEMGHFLATRPVSTTDMAYTILKTTGKSVIIAWAIWAFSFLLLLGIMPRGQTSVTSFIAENVRWWYFPATLLAWWTAAAMATSIMLAGRWKPGQIILGTLIGLTVTSMFLAEWLLSPPAKLQLFQIESVTCGILFAGGSVWVFHTALRQRFIGTHTVALCGMVWLALSTAILFEKIRHPAESLTPYLWIIGVAAFVVVPLAAAPLAVAINRTR